MKGVIAEHAAKGLLQSGPTIRRFVGDAITETQTAITDCLSAAMIEAPAPGVKRRRVVAALRDALADHRQAIEPPMTSNIERVVQADPNLGTGLLDRDWAACIKTIDAWAKGWTAPQHKHWHERHPIVWALALAALGFLSGWALK